MLLYIDKKKKGDREFRILKFASLELLNMFKKICIWTYKYANLFGIWDIGKVWINV